MTLIKKKIIDQLSKKNCLNKLHTVPLFTFPRRKQFTPLPQNEHTKTKPLRKEYENIQAEWKEEQDQTVEKSEICSGNPRL